MALNTKTRHTKTSVRLRAIVNSYGLNANTLSKETGIDRSTISRYLSGEYTPSDENARKLAELLKVSPEWLQGEDDIENLHALTDNYNSLNELGKERMLEYSEILKCADKFVLEDTEGEKR